MYSCSSARGCTTKEPGVTFTVRVGVRISAFDTVPYRKNDSGVGVPEGAAETGLPGFGLLRGDDLDAHRMHAEWFEVTGDAWAQLRAARQAEIERRERERFLGGTDRLPGRP